MGLFEFGFVAFLVLVLGLTVIGWSQYVHAQMRRYGHIPVLWRWFSGALPHSVRNEHDRRYRAQYDPSSQHYHFKARLHRAIVRTTLTIGPPIILLAWLTRGLIPEIAAILILGGLIAEIGWRIYRVERIRTTRKLVRHIGRAAAPHVNQAVRSRHGQWIRFTDPKKQVIKAKLPKNWNGTEQQRTRFVQVVAETAGFHPGSEAEWHLEGDDSHVIITNRKAAPDHVELRDIEKDISENGEDRVTLGLGRGHIPVSVSLKEESPNFGLSIGAGGGKSQLARLVAMQVLHNGGNVLILDPKRISHAWAKGLENVHYARSTEEIHNALLWLNYEVNHRTKIADTGHDVEGEVLANVGPRTLVIAEELNEMTQRLRIWWNENRKPKDPKKSPAISALETALFMGRQVKINIFAVAQMMTALAAGSGAARENMGVRILGRYTRNNWRMLVPEFEMPFRSMRPGRVQVVTSKVTECQVAFVTGQEARDFALSGVVKHFPDFLTEPVVDAIPAPDDVIDVEVVDPANQGMISESKALDAVVERKRVTLSEAAGGCVKRTLSSLRNAALRDPDFPSTVGVRTDLQGHPKEYWADEIIAWDKRKRGQNV